MWPWAGTKVADYGGRGVNTKLIRELQQSARTAHALPAGCYADPAFFELEVKHLLRPGWHAVARWDELPEPGDYRAIDVVGERVLLVRGQDRVLRALSGICRHRAFPIAEGEGNADAFLCPYHRWSYDLEGRLKGAPFMDEVAGFDAKACRLPELPLETWQGFVLVSTQQDAQPLAPQLTALSELLAPIGLDSAVHVGVSDWDSPWNWKIMVENFMESYHHIGPHADSLARTHPARGTHDLDTEGPCAVLENPAADGESPFYVIQVFPTLLLASTRGPLPFSVWYEMQIDRHDHIHLRIHTLLDESLAGNSEMVDGLQEVLRGIHLEDIPVCEGIQRGIQSRLWQPGPLSVQEATLTHFHRFVAERLARIEAPDA